MKNIFKKTETEEQLIIRWADSLILNSDHNGKVSKKSFLFDYYIFENPPTEQELTDWKNDPSKIIRNEALKKLGVFGGNHGVVMFQLTRLSDLVKEFLTKQGYINEPKFIEDFLTLTPKGEQVKELLGHKNYIASKKRELASLRADQNSKRLYMPIIVAICGIAVSATISWMAYNMSKTKMEKVELHQYKLDSLTDSIKLTQQNLRSQVDSISNLLLSKPRDTTEVKQQVIKSTKSNP